MTQMSALIRDHCHSEQYLITFGLLGVPTSIHMTPTSVYYQNLEYKKTKDIQFCP